MPGSESPSPSGNSACRGIGLFVGVQGFKLLLKRNYFDSRLASRALLLLTEATISLSGRIPTPVCVCMYIPTYIHTYIHTYMHACMHACMHAYIHTYITYMHACMHAYIHAYIPTYLCVPMYVCMDACVYMCACVYVYKYRRI